MMEEEQEEQIPCHQAIGRMLHRGRGARVWPRGRGARVWPREQDGALTI